jgi:uncharacterized protein YjbJ (UPF0337 family)
MGSTQDKAEGKKDQFKGSVKEGAGKLTDDESLEAEGRMDQSKGSAKEGLGRAKDAAGKAKQSVKDALRKD